VLDLTDFIQPSSVEMVHKISESRIILYLSNWYRTWGYQVDIAKGRHCRFANIWHLYCTPIFL